MCSHPTSSPTGRVNWKWSHTQNRVTAIWSRNCPPLDMVAARQMRRACRISVQSSSWAHGKACFAMCPWWAPAASFVWFCILIVLPRRVHGLPIRDCARGFNNDAQMCPQLSAIAVTEKTFFERLYLVLGLRKIAPWVNCPYAPTTPTIHIQIFLDFCAIVFPSGPSFFVSTLCTK